MEVIGTCMTTKQGNGKEEKFEALPEIFKYNPMKND
jgi:hypothetical protein